MHDASATSGLKDRVGRIATTPSISRSLGGYLALGAVLVFTAPQLDVYTQLILTVSFIYGLTAVSVDLLWGYTGILSYASGAFFGIGAYAVAIFATQSGEGTLRTVVIGGVVGLFASAAVAAIVGGLSFHSKADWLYVGVVSFAAPFIFERVVLASGTYSGSSSGLAAYMMFTLDPTTWYLLVGSFLLVVMFAASVMVRSDTGTLLKAIRENEIRCTFLGVQANRVKLVLFVATSCLTAVAGILFAVSQNVVAPDIGGIMAATLMVIWVALGGRGTLIGPVVAAVSIDYATAIVGAEFPFVWQLGLGVAFLLVVLYLPGGLASILGKPWSMARKRLVGESRDLRASAVTLRSTAGADAEISFDRKLVLQMSGVTCQFGSVTAVSDVSLDGSAGEILSIVGPNGAGKSTLMRCISNGTFRTSGEIVVDGQSIGRKSPSRISALGVSQKFQHASIFDALSIGECLRISIARSKRPSMWRRDKVLELPPSAIRVLEATGLDQLLDARAGDLSHGQKQALELAMVMATDPKVVLLDEPTAGLSHDERAVLGGIFREIAEISGKLVILVEHDLDFVREISSRMVVLHQGELLLNGSVDEVVNSSLVRDIYTGTLEEQEFTVANE